MRASQPWCRCLPMQARGRIRFATRVAPAGLGSACVRMCRSDASRERTGQWRLSRPCSSSGHGPDGGEAGIRASRIGLRSIGRWNYCSGGAGACKRARVRFATRVAPAGPGSACVRMCRSDASRERTGQWRLSRSCSSSGHGPDGGEAGIRASRIALRSIGPWNYCSGGADGCKRAAGFGSRLASLLQALVRRVYGCVGATQVANEQGNGASRGHACRQAMARMEAKPESGPPGLRCAPSGLRNRALMAARRQLSASPVWRWNFVLWHFGHGGMWPGSWKCMGWPQWSQRRVPGPVISPLR